MKPFRMALHLCAFVLAAAMSLFAQGTDPLPMLGMNVDTTDDWSRMYMFADAMKQSRGWGCPTTPWDLAAPIDSNGWPTADAGVVVLSNGVHIAGTYHLSFTGTATVAKLDRCGTVQNQAYDAATNTTCADLVVDSTATGIMLSFTATRGGVRNVKLMRPGYTNEVFTRDYLALMAPYACLRLNSYPGTNGGWTSTRGLMVSNWSDRTLPTYATQNRKFQGVTAGASWDHAIELANLLDKDLWVCVPDLATDDYVRQFATLLRDTLEPDRKIYVEWSNEVWNMTFAQACRNKDAAVAEVNAGGSNLNFDGSTNQGVWALRRVGRRIVQISGIFRSVFGDAAMMTRVRPVLAMLSASPVTVQLPLEYIDRFYGAPCRSLYGIAEAPYFTLSPGASARTDLTVDQIFADLPTGLARCRSNMLVWTAFAKYYRLRHLAYEGGPNIVGATSLAAKIAANRDPRMGSLIEQHLHSFYEQGGDQFEFFSGVGAYGQFSMCGITEDVTVRDTFKIQALARVLAAGRPAVTAGCLVPATMNASATVLRDWCAFVGTDPAGGTFLGSNTAGCSASYLIRVPSTGNWRITVRVGSATTTGRLDVLADSALVQCVSVPNTGSNQTWRDVSAGSVRLEAGLHVIRIRFAVTGFAIKSLTVDQ